jgi:predicted thioesterase
VVGKDVWVACTLIEVVGKDVWVACTLIEVVGKDVWEACTLIEVVGKGSHGNLRNILEAPREVHSEDNVTNHT